MPGCLCPGCGMAGPRLLFLTALALEFLGRAGGSQPALRSRGTATACRLDNKESESWGALLSGERGVFPLLVIPLEMGTMLRSESGAWRLKQLSHSKWPPPTALAWLGGEGQSLQQQRQLGLWVIAGILTFLALEKMFLDSKEEGTSQAPNKDPTAAAAALNGGHCLAQPAAEPGLGAVVRSIKVSGYLNLLANTIDNFTHGLAVAASFLVSKKIGLLTTMAILLHEIPHEVRLVGHAAKLQLSTAGAPAKGCGYLTAGPQCPGYPVGCSPTAAWVLPFTSGGFLYIALVNVLPDLLEEEDPWRSLQQLLLLCAGIVVMVLFSLFVD
uniref:Zinc transporter ZIP13 n=1 Tax=Nomascus leucogenys TaxID=61853 RepID=A0A2I3G6H7_NOMLE